MIRPTLIALVIFFLATEVFLLRQNVQLKHQVAEAEAAARNVVSIKSEKGRALAAVEFGTQCLPFWNERQNTQSDDSSSDAVPPRYAVSLYFSVEHDCLSCVRNQIDQLNELFASPIGEQLDIQGYTDIYGAVAQQTIDQMGPTFPVHHAEQLGNHLEDLGVASTPMLLLGDPVTGRTLFAHFPDPWGKEDRSFLEKVNEVLAYC